MGAATRHSISGVVLQLEIIEIFEVLSPALVVMHRVLNKYVRLLW